MALAGPLHTHRMQYLAVPKRSINSITQKSILDIISIKRNQVVGNV